jgi:hypothetical protein
MKGRTSQNTPNRNALIDQKPNNNNNDVNFDELNNES